MAEFINALNLAFSGGNATNVTVCKETVDHYTYYQFSLIPAILLTLLFAMSKKRRNILTDKFYGRPALIYPMDSLTRENRLCYGCAFGATAYLVYNIVFHSQYAIQYDGHRAVKTLVSIASMFIYGLVYFPVLSSVAIDSVVSLGLGVLYVCSLVIVEILKLTSCPISWEFTLLVLFRMLPTFCCFLYLLVAMPMRMVVAFKKRNYFFWHEDHTQTLDDIRKSYAGLHVASLLQKPPMQMKPPVTGIKNRLFAMAKDLFNRIIYKNKRGFRYPARIITVVIVSANVIYMVTFETFALIPVLFEGALEKLQRQIDFQRSLPVDSALKTALLLYLNLMHRFLFILYYEIIIITILAAVFAIFNILNTMSSYRAHLHELYRGNHLHIPPPSGSTSHCVHSIKYAGFQVGYIIWGFAIHLLVLALLSLVIAVLILIIESDLDWFIIWFLQLTWPFVVSAIVLMLGIMILSKFFFLQERGRYLALDNRSFYFNFTYFMFFYNIFLGMASCLIRILKAMFIGLVFLGRLDNSALSRRFEFLDPGFRAYVGYMHMDAAHSHPVVITFCRLMLLSLKRKQDRLQARQQAMEGSKAFISINSGGFSRPGSGTGSGNVALEMKTSTSNGVVVVDENIQLAKELTEDQWRKKMGARFSWHVAFTLLHNPDIRVMRKGYVNMLRQARLLGVNIPVSDTQADINFDKLQQDIADAKDRMNPAKKKDDAEEEVKEKEKEKDKKAKKKDVVDAIDDSAAIAMAVLFT